MHIKKKSLTVSFLLLMFLLSGCASLSTARLSKEQFRIDGIYYVPLINLCNRYNIEWEWDSFSQLITLKKEDKEAKFLVDSPVVLINGELEVINPAPRFYKGSLVVPLIFKDKIIGQFIGLKTQEKQRKSFYYKKYKINKIILDPGHGGKDPGAIAKSGLQEKDITLDIAKRLKELLESGGVKVIMTRNNDAFVSLEERVEIANQSNADFFISIHANANNSKNLRGFEIYYLSMQSNDINRALIAANDISRFNNMSMDTSSKDLRVILCDMIYTENQAESVRLAKDISSIISRQLNTNNRGLKSANFYILKNAQIPSILIETGYISNPSEEKNMRDISYRQNISEILAKAILGQ